MRSSELGSIRSLRHFPSVSTEFAAVVSREHLSAISIHRFPHRCQTKLHEMFQRREFHATKEKVFTKACALPYFFYSLLAHCKCVRRQLL